jgi:hypothetical protein
MWESTMQRGQGGGTSSKNGRRGRIVPSAGARVGFPTAVQAVGKLAGGLNVGSNNARGAGG